MKAAIYNDAFAAGSKTLTLTMDGAAMVATGTCAKGDFTITRGGSNTGTASLGGSTTCKVDSATQVTLTLSADANIAAGDTVKFVAGSSTSTSVLDKTLDATNGASITSGAMFIKSAVYYGAFAAGSKQLVLNVDKGVLSVGGSCAQTDFILARGSGGANIGKDTTCVVTSSTEATLTLSADANVAGGDTITFSAASAPSSSSALANKLLDNAKTATVSAGGWHT